MAELNHDVRYKRVLAKDQLSRSPLSAVSVKQSDDLRRGSGNVSANFAKFAGLHVVNKAPRPNAGWNPGMGIDLL